MYINIICNIIYYDVMYSIIISNYITSKIQSGAIVVLQL